MTNNSNYYIFFYLKLKIYIYKNNKKTNLVKDN